MDSTVELGPVSKGTLPPYLMLHQTLPTQIRVKQTKMVEFNPTYSIDKEGSICFSIPETTKELILPSSIQLYLKLSVQSKGNMITDDGKAHMIPINGIANSLFKNVEVKINNTVVSNVNNMYAYRANLENHLGMDIGVQTRSMSLVGYYPESTHFDDVAADKFKKLLGRTSTRCDDGIKKRMAMSKKSKNFGVITRIHDDICQQPKLLPPGMAMDFTFERENPKFYLVLCNEMADDEHTSIKVHRAILRVQMVTISESIMKEIEQMKEQSQDFVYTI